MTLLYGPLVNILNDETLDSAQAQADLAAARDAAVKEYSELPSHMKWNVDKYVIISMPVFNIYRG
jgi:hypothetical protein